MTKYPFTASSFRGQFLPVFFCGTDNEGNNAVSVSLTFPLTYASNCSRLPVLAHSLPGVTYLRPSKFWRTPVCYL